MILKKTAFFIFLLLSVSCVFAQDKNDFATWTSVAVDYEPNKKWELGLEGQFRLKENSSVVDEYFTEFSVEREILKDFGMGIGLRYIRENDDRGNIQGYENQFRFNIDMQYEHKVGDFDIDYRLRYQNKNEFGQEEAGDTDPASQRFRFKASTEYRISDWKLDPKFSAELFSKFGRDEKTEVDKYRLTVGTEYKIKKAGEIGIFYRFENGIDKTKRETLHILGLKYKYTFD